MASGKPKVFWAGAGIVWRRQRVLWLIFFVSLSLSFLGSRGLTARVAPALDHSTDATPRLYHHFDLSAIAELTEQPEEPLIIYNQTFLLFPVLFAIFMLFITGGILTAFDRDDRMTTGEFFEASGGHFWRFVRLLIYFAIVCIPILILTSLANGIYSHIDDFSVSPFLAFYFFIGAAIVIIFLAMCVRLWFDMAQVIAVVDDEKRMHKALRQAADIFWHNFGSLFWLYLRIAVVGCVWFGLGLYWWMIRLHPESTRRAFILAQAMILFWIATRLWQRASETAWYKQYSASSESARTPIYAPVPVPTISGSTTANPAGD
jgi:hypothetical protein